MDDSPAFPTKYRDGLYIRDYLAAKAMQGICSNPDCSAPTYIGSDHSHIAKAAYSIADAMLKESQRGQQSL